MAEQDIEVPHDQRLRAQGQHSGSRLPAPTPETLEVDDPGRDHATRPGHDVVPSEPRFTRLRRHLLRAVSTTLAAGVALGLIGLGTTTIQERAQVQANVIPAPPIAVETMSVDRVASITETLRYVGQIEPARANSLAFERAGTLGQVFVDESDRVRQGDVLARLDTRALDARRAELEARRDALEAQVALADLTLDRQSALRDRGHASSQAHDEARFQLARLQAGLVEIDAGLRAVAVDLAKSDLVAPFSGQVTARFLDEGGVVAPGVPVLGLIEADRPQLRVGVPSDRAGLLAAGMPVRVVHQGRDWAGTVAAIRPDVDPVTRAQIVLVDMAPDPGLAFGAAAELVVDAPRALSGYWVPLTALSEGGRGLWTVMTVIDGGDGLETGSETVEIVLVDGDRALVRGTLRDGAEIVVTGTHRLVPGSRVAVAAPSS